MLDDADYFGVSIAALEDLDEDGVDDLAVGVFGDDDGGTDRGAVWILFRESWIIREPMIRSVFQRDKRGVAWVPVSGIITGEVFTSIEARYVLTADPNQYGGWEMMNVVGEAFDGSLQIPAGGWFTIEIRAMQDTNTVAAAQVEKVGVGEVFITAGQSNSTSCGNTPLTPRHDTVSAWTGCNWRHAYDPQPLIGGPDMCGSDPPYGGSPWSRLGDMLAEELGVPIGFMSAGYGSTKIDQWLPGGEYYPRLQMAIIDSRTYGARAILWHQGESDTFKQTSTTDYAERLTQIIEQSRTDAGRAIHWGVALAAYVPEELWDGAPETLPWYQAAVREGQLQVINSILGVFRGPDTDLLGPAYRYEQQDYRIHFNGSGLYEHALGWRDAIIPVAPLLGDLDDDLDTDLKDLEFFVGHWLEANCGNCNGADLTGDGKVSLIDFVAIANNWQHNAKNIVKGLVGHWRLDETIGTTAYDVSEHGYNGTCVGGVSFGSDSVAGRYGKAISLDGVDDCIEIPPLNLINLNSNGTTITAWVRRNGPAYWDGVVFSRAGSTTAGLVFGHANEIRYCWNADDDGQTWNWNSGLVVPNDQWTFIALAVEPTKATIYMDDGTGMNLATNNVIHFGEEFDGITYIGLDAWSNKRCFKGAIDDVRIYNWPMTAAEIASVADDL